MARTRVRWTRVSLVFALLLIGVVVAGRSADGSEATLAGARYVVKTGDTLWEIARRLAGPYEDVRPVVDSLRQENGLGTAPLLAGDVLVLPSR
jgi:LysM domain